MNKLYEDRKWMSDIIFFLKHSWIVILTTIVAAVLTIVIASGITNVYRSQSTYYLSKSDLNSSFFTINELQFYNLLLLDVQKMLNSNKFYLEVANQEDVLPITYQDYLEGLYVYIDTESTFFYIGFDSTSKELAKRVTTNIENILPEQATEIVRITTIELIDEGIVGDTPVSPNRTMIYILGIGAGFVLGIGAILLIYLLTKRVRTSIEVEQIMESPILCHQSIKGIRRRSLPDLAKRGTDESIYLVKNTVLHEYLNDGVKHFNIIMNDDSGKNEAFALQLAHKVSTMKLKTVLVNINASERYVQTLDGIGMGLRDIQSYMAGRSKLEDIQLTVDNQFDVIGNFQKNMQFQLNDLEPFNEFIDSLKDIYDIIFVTVKADEGCLEKLAEQGPIIDAVSRLSKREIVKSNRRLIELSNARLIGVAYQD